MPERLDSVSGSYPLLTDIDRKRDAFRRQRLAETVANAARLPTYRTHWGEFLTDDLAASFTALPPIDKHWFVEHLDGVLIDMSAQVEVVTCSSGTTGKRMFRLLTTDEARFRAEFFGQVGQSAPSTLRRLKLRLGAPGHAMSHKIPGNAIILTAPLDSGWGPEQALDFLHREFTIPGVEHRVTGLLAAPSQLVQLTAILTRAGLAPADLAVKEAVLVSAPVTPALRRWLEQHWPQIDIVDRYSLSEVFGGATYSRRCGYFHLDAHVIGEFQRLSPDSSDDLAELWLTELHPFSQAQPLIRYRTKDLVTRVTCDCGRSDSFALCGRDIGVVLDPSGHHALLTQLEVLDAWYAQLLLAEDDPDLHEAALATPRFTTLAGPRPAACLEIPPAPARAVTHVAAFADWVRAVAKEREVDLSLSGD